MLQLYIHHYLMQGVLRTMDTLNKFKHSARLTPGTKPPLLCYCEHLMACAPAYRPLSKEEGLECVQCALDNGEGEGCYINFAISKFKGLMTTYLAS